MYEYVCMYEQQYVQLLLLVRRYLYEERVLRMRIVLLSYILFTVVHPFWDAETSDQNNGNFGDSNRLQAASAPSSTGRVMTLSLGTPMGTTWY